MGCQPTTTVRFAYGKGVIYGTGIVSAKNVLSDVHTKSNLDSFINDYKTGCQLCSYMGRKLLWLS